MKQIKIANGRNLFKKCLMVKYYCYNIITLVQANSDHIKRLYLPSDVSAMQMPKDVQRQIAKKNFSEKIIVQALKYLLTNLIKLRFWTQTFDPKAQSFLFFHLWNDRSVTRLDLDKLERGKFR